ncbi:MAG: hypothetical protein E7143_06030, partial [Rikenellaceae bacterium]|nr:hypothetical protein [Rikenellaceae bacterium]
QRAMFLSDRSAYEHYSDLAEQGYYNRIISGNVSQRIEVDSISWITCKFFVPLLEYPLQLIEKHRNHPICRANKTVFPVYANPKMNSYLKEIADFCGIKKQLTMHIARYTFATTITLANDVKLENVSKMLGHTNTRIALHYAHIMNESLAQEMNKIAAIMGE